VNFEERAVTFDCGAEALVGIVTVPASSTERGVLIVVGGPQYRVGSHRQLLLLSRDLAASGIPVMRFDNRGMGDSEGDMRRFDAIEVDLQVAIDAFLANVPRLREVVVWGLCGAASAALLYAYRDPRVSGLFLANPWVRTEDGLARTMIKRHYGPRLLDRTLWMKVLRGELNVVRALVDLARNVTRAVGAQRPAQDESFPERMAEGLTRFKGKVLVYLSGNDFTAREFEEICATSSRWKRALARADLEWRRLPQANHTFSTRAWRDDVNRWTREWVKSW
jgi:exosortase A-associated hydrolase 1